MAAPTKSPKIVRLLRGTMRNDRDDDKATGIAPCDDAAPPSWLNDVNALRQWQVLSEVMVKHRLLTAGNRSVLAYYCAMHGRILKMLAADKTPSPTMIAEQRRSLASLGLSVLRLPSDVPATNRFANNGKRQ